ncbi:MAG TPA: HD domain-containing protein [Candidatus Saccharimonadales bacterium]|nr:HD domain-containing protein [Candidatus Saccharimonadales bacterium]
MTKQQTIDKTRQYVETKFRGEGSGHDWWHMYRVWKLAKHIAVSEPGVDAFVVEIGALLHDIADWKFHDGDLEAGPKAARAWLESLDVEENDIIQVEDIIRNVSYKGANVAQTMKSREGRIVSDADKLDAVGAIGIARTFAYGGGHDTPMYDPAVKPVMHGSFEEYKNSKSHTINHFYEKLLLLKDKLYTKTARKIAEHRHQFMEQYLDEFYKEWEGER